MEDLHSISSGKDVSFLTRSESTCRTDAGLLALPRISAASRICCLLVVLFTLLTIAVTAAASDWQSNDEIAQVAENFVKLRYGKADSRVAPTAGHLDPRLRLPRCSARLEAFVRPGTKVASRTVVGVRCAGSKPWKVYVPVDVVVLGSVLVAKRTLPRNHVMTADDVVLESHDVSRLTSGYLSSIAEIAGMRLKHQVMGGRIVTPAMLAAEIIIRRGQSVTLVVRNEQMNISMAGKALTDGALNQRIRVENVTSQRVVEGLVRSPEYVEILVR